MQSLQEHKEEQWDLEIKSETKLLDFHIADLIRYRDLLGLLIRRDFVANYKQTVMGPVWIFLQPLLTTLMFTLVFGRIAKLSTNGMPMLPFYLSGLIPWNYFADCLNRTSSVFVANASVFGKVYFPRLVMPLSIVVSNVIRLAIQFGLFICILTYYIVQGKVTPQYELFPLFFFNILLLAVLGMGLGMLISAIATKYRDISNLMAFAVQLLMYATPIIYPLAVAREKSIGWLIELNPLSPPMELNRLIFFGNGEVSPQTMLYSSIVAVVIFCLGLAMFNKTERNFIDTV
ncbi:MAG: ABC transporter permease [Chitinophagaceae bacterium]|nr:ABC transporter permease [Chitinophagaceae bacterium]